MPDVFTQAKRSEVMARIRSRGNRDTEAALARLFRRHGITGWRKQWEVRSAKAGGRSFRVRPDFVFPKLQLAVFVDGCFWHGCPKHATWPAHRAAWWRRKIEGNRTRDRAVNRALRRAGWRVLRIWEHELARRREARLVARLRRALESGVLNLETGTGHQTRQATRKERIRCNCLTRRESSAKFLLAGFKSGVPSRL